MSKLKPAFFIIPVYVICVLISAIRGFAEESLTITTYYPSPYGSFRELRSQRIAIGDNYIDGGQYCWEGACTNTINADADLVVEGNVGIGTTAPENPLHIVSNYREPLRIQSISPTGSSGIDYQNNSGNYWLTGVGNTGSTLPNKYFIYDSSSSAYRLVIDATGSVGIGTTAPTYRLSVGTQNNPSIASPNNPFNVADAGDLIVTGGVDSLWALYDKNMHAIIGWDANNDHMGIAGVSEPAYTLRVHGSIAYNGGGDISDIRYKKNIEPIQNALAKIMDLKGVVFDWNNEKYPNEQFKQGRDIGLIAQAVEKILPEVVLTDSQGYKAIEYGNLSALLIEGVKQQQKEINELKAKNQELENKINKLTDRFE